MPRPMNDELQGLLDKHTLTEKQAVQKIHDKLGGTDLTGAQLYYVTLRLIEILRELSKSHVADVIDLFLAGPGATMVASPPHPEQQPGEAGDASKTGDSAGADPSGSAEAGAKPNTDYYDDGARRIL